MKRIIIAAVSLLMALSIAGFSNPLPSPDILKYSVEPPWIQMYSYGLSVGDTFWTSTGPVIILNLDSTYYDMIILDSSNTSGLILDSDSDYISFPEIYYYGWVGYGNYSFIGLPSLPGESVTSGIYQISYGYWDVGYNFSTESDPWEYWEDDAGGQWGSSYLIINEISIDCSWSEYCNFIELYNRGDDTVSISSLSLIGNARINFPESLVVAPGEFYVIDEADFPPEFDLDVSSDNVYLVSENYDNSQPVVDQVGWSSDHGENVSFMRYPDGDVDPDHWDDFRGYDDESSDTFENGFPSRGASNRHESPGFVIIGTRAAGVENYIDLYWTNPIWDEMYNATIAVRQRGHFPETIDDGEVVYQGTSQHVTDANLPPERWYYYTVFARDDGGEYSIPTDESRVRIYLGNQVGIDDERIPDRISYLDAYPNPFNPTTTIDYGLVESSDITLSIYNLLGQQIATIFKGVQEAGEYSVTWDASDFPSGVYFARLEAGGQSENVKMVLLK